MTIPVRPEDRPRVVALCVALNEITKRWPPERIAREIGWSESTVKRDQREIRTGPQPVLLTTGPQPQLPSAGSLAAAVPDETQARPRIPALAITLLAAAVLAVVLFAGAALLIRATHPPPPAYQLCVRYGTRAVTGIAGGGCPPGWQAVPLTPGP